MQIRIHLSSCWENVGKETEPRDFPSSFLTLWKGTKAEKGTVMSKVGKRRAKRPVYHFNPFLPYFCYFPSTRGMVYASLPDP